MCYQMDLLLQDAQSNGQSELYDMQLSVLLLGKEMGKHLTTCSPQPRLRVAPKDINYFLPWLIRQGPSGILH